MAREYEVFLRLSRFKAKEVCKVVVGMLKDVTIMCKYGLYYGNLVKRNFELNLFKN